MTHVRAPADGSVSPSEFMRRLRPELYSDSTNRSRYELDRPTLEYHLETLTARNQTHAFEVFGRNLCSRTICPNLRPATGPEGGGDSKVDTETVPVADELVTLFYVGDADAGRERWAFAFSAKERWTDKSRADVDAAVGTGRGYQRVFFITSRFARSKDRARLEDELSTKHGVTVTILDRSWIVDQVIDNDHRDLAFNYLGVGTENRERHVGPNDHSRAQQLESLDRAIADPQAFAGMPWQLAAEALAAAKLSRSLELRRHETEGRFARAIRLADSGGTEYQQLEARYESIWTAFWWFDDIAVVTGEYAAFEQRVLVSEHAKVLEFLCNLLQLLFNAAKHRRVEPHQADLAGRAARLRARLAELAADETRPNNALEATTSMLVIDANTAMLAEDRAQMATTWPRLADVLERAEGLGEFDAMRAVRLIEVMGQVAGSDPQYSELFDQMVGFVSRRKSEAEGALLLLKRAKQINFERNFEMIRLLGRAVSQLVKKEHADELAEATQLLALAYRSAGLLWAARAVSLFAVATLFVEAEESSDLPASIVPTLMLLAWIALELQDLPEVLEAVRLARGCARGLPLTEESRVHFDDRMTTFDLMVSCYLVNAPASKLDQLHQLPDVLHGLGLPHSRTWLLYALGHEAALRAEGSIPDEESPEKVHRLATDLAAQMPARRRRRPMLLNEVAPGECVTYVSGIRMSVAHTGSECSMLAAESLVAAIEAVFATLPEREVFPHAQSFDLELREVPGITEPQLDLATDRLSGKVSWPASVEPVTLAYEGKLLTPLLTIVGSVLTATCFARDLSETFETLLRTDAGAHRVSSVAIAGNSRSRIFKNKIARLDPWLVLAQNSYPPQANRPTIDSTIDRTPSPPEQPAASSAPAGSARQLPTPTDHRQLEAHSLIDVALWNQAKWRGVAFLGLSESGPPGMGLLFDNAGPARAIFNRLRGRLGPEDAKNELLVAIVQALPDVPAAHYRVLLTSNPESLGCESSQPGRLTAVTARIHTMEPSTDENLQRFLRDYGRAGVYLIAPAVMHPSGVPHTFAELAILKRRLVVKSAVDIGPNDIEAIALPERAG